MAVPRPTAIVRLPFDAGFGHVGPDLSLKTFKKFFTILVTTMVYDLGKGQIEKDVEE